MRDTLATLLRSASRKQASLPRSERLLTEVRDEGDHLYFPDLRVEVDKVKNILGVLRTPGGILMIPASNIVTDAGDIHYAQRAVGATPTNNFNTHAMATGAALTHPSKSTTYGNMVAITASLKANDAGYPQANNQDTDNTTRGAGTITHKVSYTRGDFNATGITHGLITIPSPVNASPLLCAYAWPAAFDKTVDDTLTVYVNHQLLGV